MEFRTVSQVGLALAISWNSEARPCEDLHYENVLRQYDGALRAVTAADPSAEFHRPITEVFTARSEAREPLTNIVSPSSQSTP
jgi:hypothetical protein